MREIAERARRMSAQPFSRRDALDSLAKLDEFLADEGNEDPNQRQEAEEAKASIQTASERADAYDSAVRQLRASAGGASDIGEVVKLLDKVGDLQPAGGVVPAEPLPDAVRTEVKTRLGTVVSRVCTENSDLPDLTHYQEKKRRLDAAHQALSAHLDLRQQVADAITTLERGKAERHGEQQDQTTIAVLNTMQAGGPLGQLRSWLEAAERPVCHSEKAKALQREKVTGLKAGIAKMEEFASSLGGRLDKVASAGDAGSLNQAVSEALGLYAGQPEADVLTAARERCGALTQVFAELATIDAAMASLSGREAVPGIEARVAGLLSAHDGGVLCPSQEALVRERTTVLRQRVTGLENDAARWLEERKRRVASGGSIGGLLDDLQRPPPFLTTERESELRTLVGVVQQKVDADTAGQVVRYFTRIESREERVRVLGELQRIVDGK